MNNCPTSDRSPRVTWGFILGLSFSSFFLPVTAGWAAQAPTSKSDLLHQMSDSLEALVKKVSPSVVQVMATGYVALDEKGQGETGLVIGRQRRLGSGVIIDPEGYIMTNAHVVGSGGRIQVVLPPTGDTTTLPAVLSARGRVLDARVVGLSREVDLALLKVKATELQALPIAKYADLRQGEMVFAFGSPEGLRNSVTMGVVSSVARQLDPDSPLVYIQTDAPINPGNSGGPLVNAEGELVGVNTFILTESGGNEGLGFAIPSAMVAFAYPQFRKYGHIHRGEMGVMVQTITPGLAAGLGLPRDWGVIVSDVLPGGPADTAGLKIQDIFLSVNGRAIDSLPVLGFTLFTLAPGQNAKVEVLRGTEKLSLDVPVIKRPHNVDQLSDAVDPQKDLVPELGILALEVNARIAKTVPDLREPSGVIVVAKYAASDWTENSLVTGDVIHTLNGAPVRTIAGLESELEKHKPGDSIVLQIERARQMMYLTLQIE
jgi:serine protease Do